MSSSDDISRQMLSMPALGRHFDLGTVYDAIRDATIPGYTFWNGSDLKNVKTTRNNYTDFSIIASDKLSDKFEELKVNGSLQVSILSGKIKLSGSANYLEKKKSIGRQSSVLVKLKCLTAVKKLLMEHLDESNLRYPQIQRSGLIGSASHIVTQIQYGAEATFTFTKRLSETENELEVNGKLKLGVDKFTKFLKGNADVAGNWADTNRDNEDSIECHFQGDFELPSNVDRPSTYNEAIEFAKKFLKFSSDWMAKDDADETKSLGVPITVWLYPLVLMQDAHGAPALRYEISVTLASQCVLIMENYGEVEDKLGLMLEDPLVKKLNPLQKKLQMFQRYLTSYIAELKIKFGKMVVGIRSGKIKVEEFSKLMSRISDEQFTFNSNRLEQWLDQKYKELCLIKRFQDEAQSKIKDQSKILFFPSARTQQQEMTKFPVDFGLEISYSSLARSEPFLEQLNQTLQSNFLNEISFPIDNSNFDHWFVNNCFIERIRREIVVFAELVNAKSYDEKFAFAITAPDEYDETCANQFSIIVHQKQNRILGCDAVLKVCQHFPQDRMMDIIRLLVEEEIAEFWNPFPLLALCRFYKKENLFDIIQLLIEKNIDVNCKTKNGWNALLFLCRHYDKDNLIDIVRWLMKKNINVDCKTNGGDNALTLICQYNKKESLLGIIRLLVDKNIDVNCKENGEWNALLTLCRYYDKDNLIDIVRLLIEKKIDVNCKTNDGWNALHFVCRLQPKSRLVDLVSLLVRRKIDKNVMTTGGGIGTARSFLLKRFKEDEVKDVLKMLDS